MYALSFNCIVLHECVFALLTLADIGNGFNLYYGAGAHVGGWNYKAGHDEGKNSGFNLGLDAIVGLEYSLKVAPLAFSIDWKPRLDFLPSTEFVATSLALGVKFTF